jgi:hypothetical protein
VLEVEGANEKGLALLLATGAALVILSSSLVSTP